MKLYFAPDYPRMEPYALAVILHELDYYITLNPKDDFDVAVLWEDKTFLKKPPELTALKGQMPILNINCVDISKHRVEKEFSHVFGYTSLVDPLTYSGTVVKKPNENAVRWGYVIDCPIKSREQGYVYQKRLDSRKNGYQVEYRVPIIFDEIPMVYESQRDFPSDDLLDCKRHTLTLKNTTTVFSTSEVEKIITFSRIIGMDFGELDIIRHNADGQIYILDANKTAAGYGLENRSGWQNGDRKKMVKILAESFNRGLTKHLNEYK